MSQYLVIVESDFRRSNINYGIRRSSPMPKPDAEALFERVIRGEEPSLLKPRDAATLVRTSPNQVCRFSTGFTQNESMDRITLAEVLA